jgi:hypothetical protein
MSDPFLMNRDSLLEMKALLEEYPCFTVARMLYLKNLLILNDPYASSELIRTAITVPDRRRLYYFMEGRHTQSTEPVTPPVVGDGLEFSLIDRYLRDLPSDSLSVDDAGLASWEIQEDPAGEMDATLPGVSDTPGASTRAGAVVSPGTPASVEALTSPVEKPAATYSDRRETSFLGYADYTSYLSQQPNVSDEVGASPMQGQDLIDSFLARSATREPDAERSVRPDRQAESGSEQPSADASGSNLPEDSFTETLARIYLKQKRYDRALEIFKNLSLKNPEKNTYFADQIKYLEKLINNLKK